jgi:hypothetical protein
MCWHLTNQNTLFHWLFGPIFLKFLILKGKTTTFTKYIGAILQGGPIVSDVLAPDQPKHIVSLALWTHFSQVPHSKGKNNHLY